MVARVDGKRRYPRFERVTIEWLNNDLTRASVRCEAVDSRWWRRRFVTAEVERVARVAPVDRDGIPRFASYADWRFVIGGDRVIDHDDELGHWIEDAADGEKWRRRARAERAKLKNPWSEAAIVPPARIVKR